MDKTVGSLTQFQKSVIIGSILGDGYLRIVRGRTNAFLEINHSFNQKEYVDWKYSVLKNISRSRPHERFGNGDRVAYRFFTKQHPEITKLYRKFYINGRKVVPRIQIDAIILAVWYMDDGSKCRASDIYLNSQQFDRQSQENLIDALYILGLEVHLNKDKQYERIRFLKKSIPKLKKFISPYIFSSMRYKIE